MGGQSQQCPHATPMQRLDFAFPGARQVRGRPRSPPCGIAARQRSRSRLVRVAEADLGSAAIAASFQPRTSGPWSQVNGLRRTTGRVSPIDRCVAITARTRGTVPGMSRAAPSRRRISGFIAMVVVGTALVVMVMWAVTGSWATGAVVGGVSGGVSAALYPVLVRRVATSSERHVGRSLRVPKERLAQHPMGGAAVLFRNPRRPARSEPVGGRKPWRDPLASSATSPWGATERNPSVAAGYPGADPEAQSNGQREACDLQR